MKKTPVPSYKQAVDIVYDNRFFDNLSEGALRSARVIAPLVMRLLEPKSVVDVGCGTGAWLRAFLENGVEDVLGIDGDYVDRDRLLVDRVRFQSMDLNCPRPLGRTFDLAISLEVAEHLPARVANRFVEMLIKAAPLVLFSAAIPGQGGTHHVNEQWPSYWKQLFANHGYQWLDPFRRHVCFDSRIAWWYRQNLCLYASQDALEQCDRLKQEQEWITHGDLELLHGSIVGYYASFSGLLRLIPGAAWRALKNRLIIKNKV